MRDFNKKAVRLRIPLAGNIELTHRCNLRCVHCYVGDQTGPWANRDRELDTARWKELIDEITGAGCLFLLITGGEPLLRKDFAEIYLYAKTRGLLIAVFTNGTLISEDILDLFTGFPPKAVEITLYGASKETYERITGVKGSYQKCLQGIRRLIDRQINIKLKTILMELNRHEFFEIENMAKELGTKFRFDAALFPSLEGNKSPLGLRVSAEDAVDIELSDDGRLREWKDFFERMKELPVQDTLYNCGAGLTSFHIDPYGTLKPCMMVAAPAYDLNNGSFKKGWSDVIPRIREKKAGAGNLCNLCKKRTLCGYCPGFFNMEKGSEEVYSEYLCEMGQLRYEKINEVL